MNTNRNELILAGTLVKKTRKKTKTKKAYYNFGIDAKTRRQDPETGKYFLGSEIHWVNVFGDNAKKIHEAEVGDQLVLFGKLNAATKEYGASINVFNLFVSQGDEEEETKKKKTKKKKDTPPPEEDEDDDDFGTMDDDDDEDEDDDLDDDDLPF